MRRFPNPILPAMLILLLSCLRFPQSAIAQSSLSIGSVSQNTTSLNLYDKFEIKFDISGTVATNPDFPYDPENIAGLAASVRNGITVDGLFLPPGQTNWANAIVQPAFLHQPTIKDRNTTAGNNNSEWIYPVGEAKWTVRFAPKQKGNWQFKLRAQDASSYPNWLETAPGSFSVTDARRGVHGFVEVSKTDPRYFQWTDGTAFVGSGYNTADSGIIHAEQRAEKDFQIFAVNGIDFYRIWMSMETVWSRGTHGWDAWKIYSGGQVKNSDEIRVSEKVYLDQDVSLKLAGSGSYIVQFSDGSQFMSGALEANKTYKVRLIANHAGNANDLVVRLLSSSSSFNSIKKELAPNTSWTVTDLGNGWKRYESTFTNDQGRILFKASAALAVGLKGAGPAYFDEVFIGEDLGGGKVGPNVVFKGKLNYHHYFDPIAASNWDDIYEHAARYGIALKAVINDKQDFILTKIDFDTNKFDPKISVGQHANFHSKRGHKVRRLHEYWWRYLAARWGYSRGVHSWELVNEGNPGGCFGTPTFCPHFDHTNHLAEVTDKLDKNHMASTSFWNNYPLGFWGNGSTYPSLDYADVHAYTSTGTIIDPIFNDSTIIYDAARYHFLYSGVLQSKMASQPRPLPIVRGEAGIDATISKQGGNQDLIKDTYGVWLHNYSWARLHPGGLYEMYWWSNEILNNPGPDGSSANGLHEVWQSYKSFMGNIPINAGGYVDIAPSVSNSQVRAMGQKNNNGSGSTLAHLWIQNSKHTWKNVIDNVAYGTLSGTVTVGGMKPSSVFTVEWWDFNTRGKLSKRTETLTSNSSGQLTLSLNSLVSIDGLAVTDTAVKIGTYVPLESPVPDILGDANNDGLVNTADFKIMITNYAKLLSGVTNGDFSANRKVNLVDYGIWYKNRTN